MGRRLGLGWHRAAVGVSAGEVGAETWSRHTHHRTRSADALPIKKAQIVHFLLLNKSH